MNPIEELGKTLTSHMRQVVRANSGISIELGKICPEMELCVDSLGSINKIPKGEYMISKHLQLPETYMPDELRGLKIGDRVLVAWAGTEPIVVDIVISS